MKFPFMTLYRIGLQSEDRQEHNIIHAAPNFVLGRLIVLLAL